jgi:hypothetical protein
MSRLAIFSKSELDIFQKYGKLQMTTEEVICIHRDIQLNKLGI